jgi:hypothetical protein
MKTYEHLDEIWAVHHTVIVMGEVLTRKRDQLSEKVLRHEYV